MGEVALGIVGFGCGGEEISKGYVMKSSVIIPVYNEEKTISEILRQVKRAKLPRGWEKEIVVVDDGSTDSTKCKVQSAKLEFKIKNLKLLRHKKNRGKGAAVNTGLKQATGEVVVIQDADLEYSPEDYERLLRPIIAGEAEVVYGSRLASLPLKLWGRGKTPLVWHYVGNKLLTKLTNLIYGATLTDMETCYKMMKRRVFTGMKLNSRGFGMEPELTAKLLKRGYRIVEVPIKVKPRGYEEGKKIHWWHGLEAVWTLIKYKVVD